jgi:hypothetical protein
MKMIYAHRTVRNRRLASGEVVEFSEPPHGFAYEPLPLAEALMAFVGCPSVTKLSLMVEHDVPSLVEYLISDALLSFAKTKLSTTSEKTRRSLYQELQGVAPSTRRVLVSATSQLKAVLGWWTSNPMERHLAQMRGTHPISAPEPKILTETICSTAGISFDSPRSLRSSTKREVLDWIRLHRDSLRNTAAVICFAQRDASQFDLNGFGQE